MAFKVAVYPPLAYAIHVSCNSAESFKKSKYSEHTFERNTFLQEHLRKWIKTNQSVLSIYFSYVNFGYNFKVPAERDILLHDSVTHTIFEEANPRTGNVIATMS